MEAQLYLFDDDGARAWSPFALTRPVGEMLFGCLLLRQRAERFWGTPCRGHVAGEELSGFREPGAPPAVGLADLGSDAPRILFSSRAVPDLGTAPGVEGPATLVLGDEVVGWVLPAGAPTPDEDALARPGEAAGPGPRVELEGSLLGSPWELVEANPARTAADVPLLHRGSDAFLPSGVQRLGTEPVSLGRHVDLEPGVVFDTRGGPVRVEDGCRILAHARIQGPVYLGRSTTILGGSVAGVSVGPVCKVRGEVEASVFLGYANKAHDGYLGHACVGRWVNLGALTTNSDLKNNYGTVRVRTPAGDVDTGLLKVGCFLGDHVKTGIGTLLNTGTVIGAGSNVFSGLMPPTYVPPFSWGAGEVLAEFRLDRFLEVAERVMARRDVELTDDDRALLTRAWERTREERAAGGRA